MRSLLPLALSVMVSIVPAQQLQKQNTEPKAAAILNENDDPPSISWKGLFVMSPELSTVKVGESRQDMIPPKAPVAVHKSPPSPGKSYDGQVTIIGYSNEQCVIYAELSTGITKHLGYAGTAQPEGQVPEVGSIGLEVRYGHAFVVVEVDPTGVLVHEANYVKGAIDQRFVPYSDVRGYVYK